MFVPRHSRSSVGGQIRSQKFLASLKDVARFAVAGCIVDINKPSWTQQ